MLVPVYDIKNCGPRHRFAANGKLVHNSDSINMQNLPRLSPLKNAIKAPEGYILVDCDSSQIEARTLAWLAGQNDLVAAFDAGEDVYKIMASAIYGKPEEEINKQERFIGKTTVLGAGYGMGAAKFRMQLQAMGVTLSQDECEYIIHVYRNTYPMIPLLWKEANSALEAMIEDCTAPFGLDGVVEVRGEEGIYLPNGLRIQYPNLRHEALLGSRHTEMVYDTKKGRATIQTRIYGGKSVENVCQALARIVIGEQMLMVARRFKIAMTVHDAVVAVVPEYEAEEGILFVEQCMRVRPKWAAGLPLNCESKEGVSYGG